jgi:hypothetical protein
MVTYVNQKNFLRLSTFDSNQSRGVHATKIKSVVSDDTGHAANRSTPVASASKRLVNRFKKMVSCKNRRCLAA